MFIDTTTPEGLETFEKCLTKLLTEGDMELGESFEDLITRIKGEWKSLTHIGLRGHRLTLTDGLTINHAIVIFGVEMNETDTSMKVIPLIKRKSGQPYGFTDETFKPVMFRREAVDYRYNDADICFRLGNIFYEPATEILFYATRPDPTNT